MSHSGIDIPVVETERLVLRGFTERDFPAYAAMRADAKVMTFLGGPQDPHTAWRGMAAMVGHWALRGFGFFCVEEKASGTCIGHCGPWYPHDWPDYEIGYTLARSAQGKGYATEAARAALRFAYEDLGWTTAISVIDPQNHASQNVARKLGATKERQDVPIWDFTADIWRHRAPAQFLAQPQNHQPTDEHCQQ